MEIHEDGTVDCPNCSARTATGMGECAWCDAPLNLTPAQLGAIDPSSSTATTEVGFRTPRPLATALQVLFAAWTVLAAVALALDLIGYRIVDNPLTANAAQVDALNSRQETIGIVTIVALVLTGILFIAWMRRLHDNLRAFGRTPAHGSGWVIGGWLVPILNLWRPKQIIDDLWRGSDPGGPQKVPPLLHWWWGFWIAGGFVGNIVALVVGDWVESRGEAALLIAISLVVVVSAILAFWVVTTLTARQEATAASITPADWTPEPAPAEDTPPERPRSQLAALPALAVAAAIVGYVVLDATTDNTTETTGPTLPTVASADGEATMLMDLAKGDCWNPPEGLSLQGGLLMAVDVVPCDQLHLAEVIGVTDLPAVAASYPGDDEIFVDAQEKCFDVFDRWSGTDYESSPLDVFYFTPAEMSWEMGERWLICSVMNLGMAPMRGRAASVTQTLPGQPLAVDFDSVSTCEGLADIALGLMQELIDIFDSLTEEELMALDPDQILPGSERLMKRDTLLVARAMELGCTSDQMNDLLRTRASELSATTLNGESVILVIEYEGMYYGW